jgi:hypothetical protein
VVDVEVAELPREAVRAWIEHVTEHQSGADARTQRHHQEARVLAAVPVQSLTERRAGGIVLDGDWATAKPPRQLFSYVNAGEARHVGEPPAATLCVYFAWNCHAHGFGFRTQAEHGVRQQVENVTWARARTRCRDRGAQYFASFDYACLDVRPSEIHAD